MKTALGATESVTWEYAKDPKEVILKLKEQGVKICALELTDSSLEYYKVESSSFPICLVVGNEITGVQQELLDLCDFSIEIPQYGIKQSLNVAVAYGLQSLNSGRSSTCLLSSPTAACPPIWRVNRGLLI